jgi:hypothetical protein
MATPALRKPGADDVAFAFECVRERVRRREPCTRCDGALQQHVVETTARHAAQRDVRRHVAAVRRIDANARRRTALGAYPRVEAEASERVQGVGNQRVAADLVARKRAAIDEQHVAALRGQDARGGGAGRAGADDQDIGGFTPYGVHNRLGARSRRRWRGLAPASAEQ